MFQPSDTAIMHFEIMTTRRCNEVSAIHVVETIAHCRSECVSDCVQVEWFSAQVIEVSISSSQFLEMLDGAINCA